MFAKIKNRLAISLELKILKAIEDLHFVKMCMSAHKRNHAWVITECYRANRLEEARRHNAIHKKEVAEWAAQRAKAEQKLAKLEALRRFV